MISLLKKENSRFDDSTMIIQNKKNESYVLTENDARLYTKLTSNPIKDVHIINKEEYNILISILESNTIDFAVFGFEEKSSFLIPTTLRLRRKFSENQYTLYFYGLSESEVVSRVEKTMRLVESKSNLER